EGSPICMNLAIDPNREPESVALHKYDTAFNLVANNIFVGKEPNWPLLVTEQDSSANATSLGPIFYSNTFTGNIFFNVGSQALPRLDMQLLPYLGFSVPFTDPNAWAVA